jgi:indole-3-glycerol phosphate synthase
MRREVAAGRALARQKGNNPRRGEQQGASPAPARKEHDPLKERPMSITLEQIVEHKRESMQWRKQFLTLGAVRAMAADQPPPRAFVELPLARGVKPTRIIAEVKRKSPSAGLLRPEYEGESFAPESIAGAYEQAGAAAISCLTDEEFFAGHLSFIARIKEQVALPVLRKDFIIDAWQLYESRAAQADAVLLMAECLEGRMLDDMASLAVSLGLGVLLEIHDAANLDRALGVLAKLNEDQPQALLGVNNRDLSTMKVDLGHTAALAPRVADRSVMVSESGIRTADDLAKLRDSGVCIALVGEHLMKQPDPGAALRQLLES